MASISINCPTPGSTLPFAFDLCGNFDAGLFAKISFQQTNHSMPVFTDFFAVPVAGNHTVWSTNLALNSGQGNTVTLTAFLYLSNSVGAAPVATSIPVMCNLSNSAIAAHCGCLETTTTTVGGLGVGTVGS
jgi:hypothetical protein